MKLRPTQSFNDAITNTRSTFGTGGNDRSKIVKRALIAYKKQPFDYSKPNDKGVGNPVSISVDFRTTVMDDFVSELSPKEIQGITIAFCNDKIENRSSRRQSPLKLDTCTNYTEEKINE